jgi:hypothetical protein
VDFALLNILRQFGVFGDAGIPDVNRFGPFKGIGHLGLPQLELEELPSLQSFDMRAVRFFNELLRRRGLVESLEAQLASHPGVNDRSGLAELLSQASKHHQQIKALLGEIDNHSDVARLRGMFVASGGSRGIFQESELRMWYLWCANEVGPETAREHLHRWLAADEVRVLNTLWVYGINVEQELELAGGYAITPAEQLPDSRDKEHALQHDMPTLTGARSVPKAAITRWSYVKRLFTPEEMNAPPNQNTDYIRTQRRLHDIALVLNVLPGISCIPVFDTSYSSPDEPFGPFGGSGGGSMLYDVIGWHQTTINAAHRAELLAAVNDFDRLTQKQKTRFARILNRLSQAKRRLDMADKILDLGIALEMLLLIDDNPRREQLSLTFRLRGAWLISETPAERIENYKLMQELYDLRSDVAHTGLLKGGKPESISKVQQRFPLYQGIAEKICRRLLADPEINWESLVVAGQVGRP